MNQHTITMLQRHFAESPVLHGRPATNTEIMRAQQQLTCKFVPDYIEFLRLFGCGIVGPDPVFGIGVAQAMGDTDDVVWQTKYFREQRWPGVDGWYVISEDARGNPIGIDPYGKVRRSDHDVGDISIVADDFESFLLDRLRATKR